MLDLQTRGLDGGDEGPLRVWGGDLLLRLGCVACFCCGDSHGGGGARLADSCDGRRCQAGGLAKRLAVVEGMRGSKGSCAWPAKTSWAVLMGDWHGWLRRWDSMEKEGLHWAVNKWAGEHGVRVEQYLW